MLTKPLCKLMNAGPWQAPAAVAAPVSPKAG